MSRKTLNNIRIQQWGNTLNSWDNTSTNPALYELALVQSNVEPTKTIGLVIGNGEDSVVSLYNTAIDLETSDSAKNVFFPGIGAGYVLPTASSTQIGGLKINPYYFVLQNDALESKLLRKAEPDPITRLYYNSEGPTPKNEPLTLPLKHDLRIQGSLFVDEIIAETTINIQTESNYIDVHKKIDKEITEDVVASEGTITLTNYVNTQWHETIEIVDSSGTEITGFDIDSGTVDGKIVTILKSEKFVTDKTYTISYRTVSSDPWVLKDEETAGIRIYNYNAKDASLEESFREVAEISVTNDGNLWYTSNALGLDGPIERYNISLMSPSDISGIPLYDGSTKLLSIVEKIPVSSMPEFSKLGISFVGSGEEVSYEYDPNKNEDVTVEIRNDYCDTIIANGVEYKVSNNTINLGSPVWTEDLYDAIQSAVQKITFNGTVYTGPEITISFDYTKGISTGTGIVLTNNDGMANLSHSTYSNYKDVISYDSIEISLGSSNNFFIVSDIERDDDDLGHLLNYKNTKVSFTPLLETVSDLVERVEKIDPEGEQSDFGERITTLEGEVDTLQEEMVDLEDKIGNPIQVVNFSNIRYTPNENGEINIGYTLGAESGSNLIINRENTDQNWKVGVSSGYQIPSTTQIQAWNGKQDSLANTTILTINETPLKLGGSITIETGTSVTEKTVEDWGFTKNEGTVTSVLVAAGDGLVSSTTTAGDKTYETTISIDDDYKLPTKAEWNAITGGTSVVDTNQKIKVENTGFDDTSFGDNAEVVLKAGDNITIEADNTNNTITISATNSGGDSGDSQAVLYVKQELAEDQKSQARTNIGAGTSNLTIGSTSDTAAAGDHDHTAYVEKNEGITGGTHCKITYDSKGLVTKGEVLTAADVPGLSSDKITSLTGYIKTTETIDISASDSLNSAIGKLEKAIENASSGEVNVQSDWTETDESSDAYILNKPTIPDADSVNNWNAAYSWGNHADFGYLKTHQSLEGYVQSSELHTINGQSILDGDITIDVTDTDKKTSSGSTSSRIYLVGATSRSAEGQTTYSNGGVYVDTNNKLYSESSPVVISGTNNSTIPYKIITITSAKYQALTTKDPNTLYFIVG